MFQIRIVQPTAKQSYEKALKLVEEMDMSSDDEEEENEDDDEDESRNAVEQSI